MDNGKENCHSRNSNNKSKMSIISFIFNQTDDSSVFRLSLQDVSGMQRFTVGKCKGYHFLWKAYQKGHLLGQKWYI